MKYLMLKLAVLKSAISDTGGFILGVLIFASFRILFFSILPGYLLQVSSEVGLPASPPSLYHTILSRTTKV